MRIVLASLFCAFANSAVADTVMAARTIKAHSVLAAADLRIEADTTPDAATALSEVVGLEAKVVLYAGRPVALEHLKRLKHRRNAAGAIAIVASVAGAYAVTVTAATIARPSPTIAPCGRDDAIGRRLMTRR